MTDLLLSHHLLYAWHNLSAQDENSLLFIFDFFMFEKGRKKYGKINDQTMCSLSAIVKQNIINIY
jgi:hypothetical protein